MSNLVNLFNPKNEKHVIWLKNVDEAMLNASIDKKDNFMNVVNKNPVCKTNENPVEWAYTHFQLAMKYTQGVLRGEAWTPPQKNND